MNGSPSSCPASTEVPGARDFSNADLEELTLRISGVVVGADGDAPIYRCQATTLLEVSIPVIEGVMCSGDRSNARRLCSRAIYPYWR